MKAINITAYTEDASQIEAFKDTIKALKIKFTVSKIKEKQSTYSPDFVAKIQKSRKEVENGEVVRIEQKDLKKFLGL